MGIFTDFVSENNAEIDPFVLFSQLAIQEGDEVSSIAAYFHRMHYFPHKCHDGADRQPYPTFSFYKFNLCDGFYIPNDEFGDDFQETCLLMLRGISEGYELDNEPDSQGRYYFDRQHGYDLPRYLQSQAFEMFCFHKKELTEFLVSQGIAIPECLLSQTEMNNDIAQNGSSINLQPMGITPDSALVNGKCTCEETITSLEEENKKLKDDILLLNEELCLLRCQPFPQYEHHSEGLEHVQDAIKELWSTYDEDEPQTAPTKDEVIRYLTERGAGKNMAEAVNLVLRPSILQGIGRRSRKTR